MSSETAAPWLLPWVVLSTRGTCRRPLKPSNHWALPASVAVMVAPSALILLVVVVSALSNTSSMFSAELRTRLARSSGNIAMAASSSNS